MSVVEEITGGWDSRAFLVDGTWLDREPRRPEVRERLIVETRLMPWLAPHLPLPVPEPVVLRDEPLRVRHRWVPGEAAQQLTGSQGATLGRFLRALHAVDVPAAVALGVADQDAAFDELYSSLTRFRQDVLPRVSPDLRAAARSLLDRVGQPVPDPALVHGDVGPAHVLLVDGSISGVIDWTDARIGDRALDLAWLVNGSGAGDAAAAAYGADDALLARANDWHLLGPWHEVTYGLDTGQPALVGSGMGGVCSRLNSG